MTEKFKSIFDSFFSFFNLNEIQKKQFYTYFELLDKWNAIHNITSIKDPKAIVLDHFWDSLSISKAIDLTKITSVADIGSGGGFPIIPIKIMYPHLKIYPIEVIQKKVAFLEALSEELKLENVTVCDVDWRNFLRSTSYEIELFTARASLHMDELLRMFKPSCLYKDSQLIYWASESWNPSGDQKRFIYKQFDYKVGNKVRKLIFFKNSI
jgi:16S rRNA (guanine(527)-N(7))-methyltransferase RsmG